MSNGKNWTWYEKYKYWRKGKTVVRIGLELFRRAQERNDMVEMSQYAGNVVSDLARMYFYCPRLTKLFMKNKRVIPVFVYVRQKIEYQRRERECQKS
jgi:hypothetical protein